MKLNLDQEKDKFFMHLFSQGVKFPHNLNVDNLIQKEEPSPLEFVMKQIEEMRKEPNVINLTNDIQTTKQYAYPLEY